MSTHTANFSIGEVVHHVKSDYRGVIVDVDATFQGTEQWYHEVAKSRPPKELPWYHVLVDGADHSTYVAERHLERDPEPMPIRHPNVGDFFDTFEDGHYSRSSGLN
jgi:heat shock protein HspQ